MLVCIDRVASILLTIEISPKRIIEIELVRCVSESEKNFQFNGPYSKVLYTEINTVQALKDFNVKL